MNTEEVLQRICRLPFDFYDGGAKSMVELVSESGIDAHPEVLEVAGIATYFRSHSELVAQWLHWSANKRVTSGWHFTHKGDRFVVGFYPKGESWTFEDRAVGCAEFVVREVQELVAISRKKFPKKN